MKRFLIVILLTALLPDVSIWSLYLREVPLLVSILWFLPTTLLTAAWLALVFEFRHSLAARTLNGCILCFVVPRSASFSSRLSHPGWVFSPPSRPSSWPSTD